MYELIILNLINNERFTKIFDSEYLKDKFVKKCKKSTKIRIVGDFKV